MYNVLWGEGKGVECLGVWKKFRPLTTVRDVYRIRVDLERVCFFSRLASKLI